MGQVKFEKCIQRIADRIAHGSFLADQFAQGRIGFNPSFELHESVSNVRAMAPESVFRIFIPGVEYKTVGCNTRIMDSSVVVSVVFAHNAFAARIVGENATNRRRR